MKIGVIGGGAWGTAVAVHLARTGNDVVLWVRETEVKTSIEREGINPFLPDVRVDFDVTDDVNRALTNRDFVFWAVPVPFMRSVLSTVDRPEPALHVNLSKGLEQGSLKFPIDILMEKLTGSFAVVSGPSFALPFAQGLPAVLVAASEIGDDAINLQSLMQSGNVRVYTSEDIRGVETGGAFKNVYAIASGISDGMGLGANARAAMITRAIVELTRLAKAMGAEDRTISGAAGLGDLILTCTSDMSRNYTFGKRIGMGEKPACIISTVNKAVEGYHTAKAEVELATKLDIEIPIAEVVNAIVYDDLSPQQGLTELLSRPSKPEWWF